MMKPYRAHVLALLLGTAVAPSAAAQSASGTDVSRLIAAARIDLTATANLYDRSVQGGTLAVLHAQLDTVARTAAAARERATARLIAAALYWRAGQQAAAMADIDSALAQDPGFDALLMKAQLVEVSDPVAAAGWYRRAQAVAPTPAERRTIAVRLVIGDALTNPDALATYATGDSDVSTQRLADVMAMLGKPAAALRLAGSAPVKGLSDTLRRAGWAAAAGDATATRAHAWQAYLRATDAGDQRYALALLVEGYRTANDLRGAEAFLAAKPQTDDLIAVRVDTLLESGRLPEAIALVRASRDPVLRRRLIGILDLTGDAAASEAEYRRLIAAAPGVIDNYVGLAAVYLGQGDEARAQQVFRQLSAANRNKPDVLADASRQMIAMGLGDDALAMVRSGSGTTPGSGTRLLLFRTYLNQGNEAKARAELEGLVAGASSDAVLGDVADGYIALQEPAKALALLRRLEATGRPLDHDRTVQLATLTAHTGATEEALTRWLSVWRSASLPARRNYAEQQIVRLAKAADRLKPLIDDSAARLRADTLRPGEFDLLVALRLAANDRQGALDDTRQLAAKGDVAVLQLAARSYARLNDYTALEAILGRLATADPVNRADYLQQRILTAVRYGDGSADVRRRQLDQLTDQLPDRGTAAGLGFRGSVYAMAGLGEDAIAEYRLALATAPQDGDALLRLADALTRQQRQGEALPLLQFAAVTAPTDDAFATALDGMLDLVGDGGTGFLTANISRGDVLRWVERRAIERWIRLGDTARLQGIMADTAAALADSGLQFRVYEAALPDAGGQRALLLRKLIALSSQPPGDNAAPGQVDDPKRKLLYARRLLALRKPFPPDVYADIATTMLEQGDRTGAERAFAMMGDAGALVNVDEVRGRAFAAAGMTDAALANLGRALVRDQGNYDLLVDTSMMREVHGDTALAFRWYWRGLKLLIARQAAGSAGGSGDQVFDFGKFGPTMIEGALLNWPTDPAVRGAALADLRELVAESATMVSAATPGALGDHQRLFSALDLSRRVQAAGHDDGTLAAADKGLDRLFVADPAYLRAAAYFRDLQGTAEPVTPGRPDWVIPGLIRQAIDGGNTSLAIALAIRIDDMDTARAVLSNELRAGAAWNAAIAANARAVGRPPRPVEILSQLIERLSADRIRTVLVPLIDTASQRETVLFDLYRQSPGTYDALAAAMGRAPIPDDRLIDLMATRGNDVLGGSARVGAGWGDHWPLDRFSVAQQLDLLDKLVTRIEIGAPASPLVTSAVTALLARPLDTVQQARLKALLLRDVAFIRNPARRSVVPVLAHLLQPRTAAGNRALLLDVAGAALQRYPDAEPLPAFLQAAFAGDTAAALRQLDALQRGLATAFQGQSPIDAIRAALAPAAATADAAASPTLSAAAPEVGESAATLLAKLLAAQHMAPTTVPAVLRDGWRGTPIDLWQRRALIGGLLLATETGADRDAWRAILARPDVLAELASYPPATDAATRHATQALYDLIARGLAAGGQARPRLDALLARLADGTIDADGTQLLVTLAAETGTALNPAAIGQLADRLRRTPALAADERLRVAAMMARSGQPDPAIAFVSAALEQAIYPLTPLDNAADGPAIVASLKRWPDAAVARRAYDALVARVTQFRATPAGANFAALPAF